MINSLVAHLVFLQKNNLALGIKENLKVFFTEQPSFVQLVRDYTVNCHCTEGL